MDGAEHPTRLYKHIVLPAKMDFVCSTYLKAEDDIVDDVDQTLVGVEGVKGEAGD